MPGSGDADPSPSQDRGLALLSLQQPLQEPLPPSLQPATPQGVPPRWGCCPEQENLGEGLLGEATSRTPTWQNPNPQPTAHSQQLGSEILKTSQPGSSCREPKGQAKSWRGEQARTEGAT